MGDIPTTRILVCGALVAGGVAVAAGCPVLAPAVAAVGVALGPKILEAAGGLAGNILAGDIVAALEGRGFDDQANYDLRRAVGQAVGAALVIEGRRYRCFHADRRGLHRLAKVAGTRWVESVNVDGAFVRLHERHAVEWFSAGQAPRDEDVVGRPASVLDGPADWLQVFGELRRLGEVTSMPSQPAQDGAAMHLHEHFVLRLRNVVKGNPNKAGANRAFAALQLDFMRLLMDSQRKIVEKLDAQHALTEELLREMRRARTQASGRAGELVATLDRETRQKMQRTLDEIESLGKRFDDFARRVQASLQRLEIQGAENRRAMDDGFALTRQDSTALLAAVNEIRRSLAEKPMPAGPDQPPAVDPRLQAAAATVERSSEASLVDRAEAAIVSRSPDAEGYLDQLDRMVEFAEFRRHQLRGDYHFFRGEYDLAVEPYERALELRPDDTRARNDAALAHNKARLGSIAEHQRRAIDLLAGTMPHVPAGSYAWAMTQNNLGNAWLFMPTGDRAENLGRAIAAYEAAQTVYTRESHPADWAVTQNNLGNAWGSMPTGDRAENLRKAIAANEAALDVYTRESHPADWATTQYNLAIIVADLAARPDQPRCELLRRAIASGKAALTVYTADAFPADHASTVNNLAIDREAYEAGGCDADVPFDAIEPAT